MARSPSEAKKAGTSGKRSARKKKTTGKVADAGRATTRSSMGAGARSRRATAKVKTEAARKGTTDSKPGSRKRQAGQTPRAADQQPASGAGAAGIATQPGVAQWQDMITAMMGASQKAMLGALSAGADAAGGTTGAVPMGGLHVEPEVLRRLQSEYGTRVSKLLSQQPDDIKPTDNRFGAPEWHGVFGWNAALYELNAEFIGRMAQALSGPERDVQRVRFAVSQWVDAMSPSNFLVTNPQAQKAMLDSKGKSLQDGMQNLLADIARGRISQTDEDAFVVGENLAVTPGQVVFENELIQLIQYAPSTPKVGSVPMLMVPPCINKYYILDLQPSNSVVAWLVGQGHTVFMVSWKNVGADQGGLTWDDYLDKGAITAINVVREICDVPRINTLGFCVGGTIIATALAVLAARGEEPAASLTLLTTLLDFENPGVLNLFVDEAHVSWRESTIGSGGIMAGSELAQTFSSLRPNDLIWNYVTRNYLQGEKPPAFDLLYWNSDSTNLPGPMFAWYLRHMYLQNDLVKPGTLVCLGEKIDLGRIRIPVFVYGSREDHIVPWDAAYASRAVLGGPTEFVLGASGHIAGVINHPDRKKRHYWTNSLDTPLAEDWLAGAEQHPGSWWPHWAEWLESFSGEIITASDTAGSTQYPPIEPAPGRYVKEPA